MPLFVPPARSMTITVSTRGESHARRPTAPTLHTRPSLPQHSAGSRSGSSGQNAPCVASDMGKEACPDGLQSRGPPSATQRPVKTASSFGNPLPPTLKASSSLSFAFPSASPLALLCATAPFKTEVPRRIIAAFIPSHVLSVRVKRVPFNDFWQLMQPCLGSVACRVSAHTPQWRW